MVQKKQVAVNLHVATLLCKVMNLQWSFYNLPFATCDGKQSGAELFSLTRSLLESLGIIWTYWTVPAVVTINLFFM